MRWSLGGGDVDEVGGGGNIGGGGGGVVMLMHEDADVGKQKRARCF